jgi:hypothetical protein
MTKWAEGKLVPKRQPAPTPHFTVNAVMNNGSTQRADFFTLASADEYFTDLEGALFKCLFSYMSRDDEKPYLQKRTY